MIIRKNKNRKGTYSIQIISKVKGKNRVIKTLGSGDTEESISKLYQQARQEMSMLQRQTSLFISDDDSIIESYLLSLQNAQIRTIGSELILGRIYDKIGFGSIQEELFRHLVIARIAFPLSKLKTVGYLYRYQGISININKVYRFLDKLNNRLKEEVEQIAYKHTLEVLKGTMNIVFYDMTTLYFEASDEDDLRKTGFSKDGKHQQPQIFLGLVVGLGGYAIGYDIFEGNIFEGHTLIPVLQKMEKKFNLKKPIVVADAGLLSNKNIQLLEQNKYKYIIGARLKNESTAIKKEITNKTIEEGQYLVIKKDKTTRLIISFSNKRAKKDEHNRKRGLERLEKNMQSMKLTKSSINNRGYNKYLKLEGDVKIEIDYEKFKADKNWDGLKGYITNTKLKPEQIIDNYQHLWQIEKAFRISKTDLRIRPIYHRTRNRIEAHICIAFTAYSVYKELERLLQMHNAPFSVKTAIELTHTMYQINVILPESKHTKNIVLKMDEQQALLKSIIDKIK